MSAVGIMQTGIAFGLSFLYSVLSDSISDLTVVLLPLGLFPAVYSSSPAIM